MKLKLDENLPDELLGFARKHLPPLLALDLSGHLAVVTERGVRWR